MKYLTYMYNAASVQFNTAAWINATEIAAHFGKQLSHYFDSLDTNNYINALCELSGGVDRSAFLFTKRGRNGGTWMHPDLAVHFGRWIDYKFAIWCDIQINHILSSQGLYIDWSRARHAAASTYNAMSMMLDISRANIGKETKSYHYSNEARLINWALNGIFSPVDRDTLSMEDLKLLATLELVNISYLGLNLPYDERKRRLAIYSEEWKAAHRPQLIQQPVTYLS